MIDNSQILSIVTFVYGLAAVLYLAAWVFRKDPLGKVATWVTWAAWLGNTAGILLRWYESYQAGEGYGHAPLSNLYESLIFFAWTIGIIYLVVEYRYKSKIFGAFAIPLACLALAYASLHTSMEIQPLIPALKSNWLIAHVIACFIGYSAFAVAFGTSIIYLAKNREAFSFSIGIRILLKIISAGIWAGALLSIAFLALKISLLSGVPIVDTLKGSIEPSLLNTIRSSALLDVLAVSLIFCGAVCSLFYLDPDSPVIRRLPDLKLTDVLTHQLILFGFLFLTVGIITGAVWANSAWGRYWGWDPKETWSFVTWLVYATLLHARLMRGWRGNRIAILTLIGFAAVLFTYFGVNLLPGLHSYGAS
jgi:cytochrome c-type biogenesis protein CcsB